MPAPDETDAPPPPAPAPPVNLDYFAARSPERRQSRAVFACSVALALGCIPYLCGIVNALVAAGSYSAAATTAHTGGAAVFMGTGIALSAGALWGFVRLRHLAGAIAAVLLLGMQVSVAACLAFGRVASAPLGWN